MPDESYFVSDIQFFFEYIIKKRETITVNPPPVEIYAIKIKIGIFFKIKVGYKLELFSEETMRLLGRSKKDVDQNKDGKNMPKLGSVEVVLVICYLLLSQINKLIS